MNYMITSDTHLGHNMLVEKGFRPMGFEEIILLKHEHFLHDNDILIHLGDVCLYKDEYWHERLMGISKCKKWLIKGNHDRRSNTWYINHGWDFVADSMTLNVFGAEILLTHIPQRNFTADFNVHGHCHNLERESDYLTEQHKLVMMEHTYSPQNLRKIIGK